MTFRKRSSVFISYSHRNASWLARLQVHLKPLERACKINIWNDTRILAGAKWQEEIERALNDAAVAILLISADFLASDFISENELPPLLRAAEQGGTLILPIILSPCSYKREKGLADFQAVNDPSKPLSGMSKSRQEAVFQSVADRIADLLNTLPGEHQETVQMRKVKSPKRSLRKRRVEPQAETTISQTGNTLRPGEVSNKEEPKGRSAYRNAQLLLILAVGTITIIILVILTIRKSAAGAGGVAILQKTDRPRIKTAPPLLGSVQPQSKIVGVSIENGSVAKIFDDRLVIQLDGIKFDKGENQYRASFTVSSADAKPLAVEDAKVWIKEDYVYPSDKTFKINLVSVQESYAEFIIEETGR